MADVWEVPYRARWRLILGGGFFFGMLLLACVLFALTNRGGLIIGHPAPIIELSPRGAAIFFWVLAAFFGCFFVFVGSLAVHRLMRSQRIAFTRTALLVPRSRWSADELAVPFGSITKIELHQIRHFRDLHVCHSGGLVTIRSYLLPSRVAFDEIHQFLRERMANAGRGTKREQDKRGRESN